MAAIAATLHAVGVALATVAVALTAADLRLEAPKRADRLPLLFPDCRLPAADCPPEAP